MPKVVSIIDFIRSVLSLSREVNSKKSILAV